MKSATHIPTGEKVAIKILEKEKIVERDAPRVMVGLTIGAGAKATFKVKLTRTTAPLDTWVYAFAAAHHPELRLHRYTKADWDKLDARLQAPVQAVPASATAAVATPSPMTPKPPPLKINPFHQPRQPNQPRSW